jgi:hypothetical protein
MHIDDIDNKNIVSTSIINVPSNDWLKYLWVIPRRQHSVDPGDRDGRPRFSRTIPLSAANKRSAALEWKPTEPANMNKNLIATKTFKI